MLSGGGFSWRKFTHELTDTSMKPEMVLRYYQVRFQQEHLFRDAKQYTGFGNCQSNLTSLKIPISSQNRLHYRSTLSEVLMYETLQFMCHSF
jgi:hypothetical protein